MRSRKFAWLLLVSSLLLISLRARIAVAETIVTRIYIDPSTTSANVGDSFSVSIRIEEAKSVYTYDVELGYSSSVLNATSVIEGDFPGLGGIWQTYFTAKIFPEENCLYIGNTLMGAPVGIDGTGTLATINFDVVGAGESGLHLYRILLVDSFNHKIEGVTWEDGYFNVAPTVFSLEPSSIDDPTIIPGDVFSVNLSISDVEELSSFKFNLGYDNTLLNVTDVSVVPFLNEPTIVDTPVNHTLGFVRINVTSEAAETVSGSGTLANVTFEVLKVGACILDLYDTSVDDKLARLKVPPFEHNPPAQDGYFSNIPIGHEIAMTQVTVLPVTVTVGEKMSINATVTNAGEFNETFDVTAYYDGNVIETRTGVSLDSGKKTFLTFSWDTSGVSPGTYTIKVVAATVEGETKVINNTFVYGAVTVEAVATSNLPIYIGAAVAVVAVVIVTLYFARMRKPKPV